VDSLIIEEKRRCPLNPLIKFAYELSKLEGEWAFRGDFKSEITSSLDRIFTNHKVETQTEGQIKKRRYIEKKLIREFQRAAHHYLSKTPPLDDRLQWIALLQHHGGPTRLVDFTYSPYIALYFAINNSLRDFECVDGKSPEEELTRYITGISMQQLKDISNCKIISEWKGECCPDKDDRNYFVQRGKKRDMKRISKLLFSEDFADLVYPITPFILNERILIQQGTFLCPGTVDKPFKTTLENAIDCNDEKIFLKKQITFTFEQSREALADLKKMNITKASLFPGIDGLAQSLANHWVLTQKRDTPEGEVLADEYE